MDLLAEREPSTAISLFSGGGGLDYALKLAVPACRTVCYVEREAYATACLVARMEDATLDSAPVWDDVATFDGRPWRGHVDLVVGGFPCQDISNAGKGAGLAGERSGLWREYRRIVDEVHPRLVFIENVAALRNRGLEEVLGDLAALGFDAEWATLKASDVGATHQRDRIFILAHAASERRPCGRLAAGSSREHQFDLEWRGEVVGDAHGAGLEGRGVRERGRSDEWLARAASSEGVPIWPPGPDDHEGWEAVLRVRPDLEPAVRRVAHGLAHRCERLRVLGNGVVPLQAARAYVALFNRLMQD